jgi:hypothetical protein
MFISMAIPQLHQTGHQTGVPISLEAWKRLLQILQGFAEQLENQKDLEIFQGWLAAKEIGTVETISLSELVAELSADNDSCVSGIVVS